MSAVIVIALCVFFLLWWVRGYWKWLKYLRWKWRAIGYYEKVDRRQRGLCENCGYDLRASQGRCPECGAPVPDRRIG